MSGGNEHPVEPRKANWVVKVKAKPGCWSCLLHFYHLSCHTWCNHTGPANSTGHLGLPMGQVFNWSLRRPCPTLDCLSKVLQLALDSSFLPIHSLGTNSDGSSDWILEQSCWLLALAWPSSGRGGYLESEPSDESLLSLCCSNKCLHGKCK